MLIDDSYDELLIPTSPNKKKSYLENKAVTEYLLHIGTWGRKGEVGTWEPENVDSYNDKPSQLTSSPHSGQNFHAINQLIVVSLFLPYHITIIYWSLWIR